MLIAICSLKHFLHIESRVISSEVVRERYSTRGARATAAAGGHRGDRPWAGPPSAAEPIRLYKNNITLYFSISRLLTRLTNAH